MRLGYKIVLVVLPLAAISVIASWFLAQNGEWYYWIFEVLGFFLLLIFGMLGLLLPLIYQSPSRVQAQPPEFAGDQMSSVEPPTITREELDSYWRSGGRVAAVVFVSTGAFVGFLDVFWVYEVFFKTGQGVSLLFGAVIATVLGILVLICFVAGIRSFAHRPVGLEVTADGLRIRHANASDLAIRWSDRKLWLIVEDQRGFYQNSRRHAPWELMIDRRNTYGVSTAVAEGIVAELRVHRPDVTEITVPISGGRTIRRYFIHP